jgi:hypothetical protein
VYASRLAGRLNRNWHRVCPNLLSLMKIDAETQRVLDTLTPAQQLGATVFTYKGDDASRPSNLPRNTVWATSWTDGAGRHCRCGNG